MSNPLRIPLTLATKKGAGYLAQSARKHTVILADHGKHAAVIMNPERFDELERSSRHAADRLAQGVTDLVAEKSEFRSVGDVRERLHARR